MMSIVFNLLLCPHKSKECNTFANSDSFVCLIRIGNTGKEREAETPPPPKHTKTPRYINK